MIENNSNLKKDLLETTYAIVFSALAASVLYILGDILDNGNLDGTLGKNAKAVGPF